MADVLDAPMRHVAAPATTETGRNENAGPVTIETEVSRPIADPTPTPPPANQSVAKPQARGNFTPMAWGAVALVVAVLLWGAWVTKHLVAPPAPLASVRLEAIVTEYVQAQSHSNGTPEAVTQQTTAFMAALDAEMRKIGESGTTVLVGEAVLSKNVPDITDEVRRAVYARVPLSAAAPAGSAPSLGTLMPSGAAPVETSAAPPAAPVVSPFGAVPSGSPLDATMAPSIQGKPSGYAN